MCWHPVKGRMLTSYSVNWLKLSDFTQLEAYLNMRNEKLDKNWCGK